MTSILAHADHPELFFFGLLTGAALVAAHFVWQRVKNHR
jgi:hypothetical protein